MKPFLRTIGAKESTRIAKEHQDADAACGRQWECACGACNQERKNMLAAELKRSDGRWTATAELLSRNINKR